jgi:hypothetical protein
MANGHYRGQNMRKLLKIFILVALALLCLTFSWLSAIALVVTQVLEPLLKLVQ